MAGTSLIIGGVAVESIVIFILVFISTIILANIIYVAIIRLLKGRSSNRFAKFFGRIIQYLIYLAGLYFGLYHILGLNLTAIGTSLGIIGLVVAFSSQMIIQNFIAGILVGLSGNILIDEWVEIGASGPGKVIDITLSKTTLGDINGKLLYIPNSTVISSNIVNYGRSGFAVITIPLAISSSNFEFARVHSLITDVLDKVPGIMKENMQHLTIKEGTFERIAHLAKTMRMGSSKKPSYSVMITGISASAINLSISFFISSISEKNAIVSSAYDLLLARIRKEKIALA
jgi:small-conductance mechanosensitive channel